MSDIFYDKSRYIPASMLSPDDLRKRREAGRLRSQKYYERKRQARLREQVAEAMYGKANLAPCSNCGEHMVLICGFCKDGLHG